MENDKGQVVDLYVPPPKPVELGKWATMLILTVF